MIKNIILAARPKTLAAGIVPVWAGCLIVDKYQALPQDSAAPFHLDLSLAFFILASSLCIQIACNFFNDAIDARNKADTDKRQGPQRITASGRMSARSVSLFGGLFLIAAALFAIPLLQVRGLSVLAIGIPSMILAYGYTGKPFRLAYRGLGELFVLLFFGLIAVMGTVYVQIGWHSSYAMIYGAAFILGMQCGLLSCVLIEINNIRDRKEDEGTGKRTLAVRLGDKRARGLALAFLIAPYITLKQTAFFLPHLTWSIAWLAPLLLAGYLILKIRKTPANKQMNSLLGLASLHLILFLSVLSFS